MNKKIRQLLQKINSEKILSKKFYPVWFFTNEKIGKSLPQLPDKENIKKIFGIGGAGDFAFTALSIFENLDEINVCDIREVANITIDFKVTLFKEFAFEEVLELFLNFKSANKKQIYERIKEKISPTNKNFFDFIINNCKENNFLLCLKKSGLWYKDSFWQIKHRAAYLPYLTSETEYQSLKKKLKNINIYGGDFYDNLKLSQNIYYDLIYTSNILDSKFYCKQVDLYLKTVKDKLNKNGIFLIVTQAPKKMLNLIEEYGFRLFCKELHRFNALASLLGHYSFSFLFFKK